MNVSQQQRPEITRSGLCILPLDHSTRFVPSLSYGEEPRQLRSGRLPGGFNPRARVGRDAGLFL
jgi:hypothetical protein